MNTTPTQLGTRFVRAGLRLFILGLFMCLGMISHYLIGARYDNGAAFLTNVSVWFGCPWTLSTAVVLLGAIGMIAIGGAYATLGRASSVAETRSLERLAFHLCTWSLVAIFLTGFVGYFFVDAYARGFYYVPIKGPKNFWLLEQLACVMLFLAGVFMVSSGVKRMGQAAAA